MKEDYLKFAEWVAEQITIEKLEYDFSDGIWFYENAMGEILQFKTDGLYQVYCMDVNPSQPKPAM